MFDFGSLLIEPFQMPYCATFKAAFWAGFWAKKSIELQPREEDEEVNSFLDRNKYYWIGLNDKDREGRDYYTILHWHFNAIPALYEAALFRFWVGFG